MSKIRFKIAKKHCTAEEIAIRYTVEGTVLHAVVKL